MHLLQKDIMYLNIEGGVGTVIKRQQQRSKVRSLRMRQKSTFNFVKRYVETGDHPVQTSIGDPNRVLNLEAQQTLGRIAGLHLFSEILEPIAQTDYALLNNTGQGTYNTDVSPNFLTKRFQNSIDTTLDPIITIHKKNLEK